jgi:phosphopentomutase
MPARAEGWAGDCAAFHRDLPGDFQAHLATGAIIAIAPPAPTLLDWVQGRAGSTHAVGKIGDIFSHAGDHGNLHKGKDRMLPFSIIWTGLGREAEAGSLTFANFVEFDSLYRSSRAMWRAMPAQLEWFDAGGGVPGGACGRAIW